MYKNDIIDFPFKTNYNNICWYNPGVLERKDYNEKLSALLSNNTQDFQPMTPGKSYGGFPIQLKNKNTLCSRSINLDKTLQESILHNLQAQIPFLLKDDKQLAILSHVDPNAQIIRIDKDGSHVKYGIFQEQYETMKIDCKTYTAYITALVYLDTVNQQETSKNVTIISYPTKDGCEHKYSLYPLNGLVFYNSMPYEFENSTSVKKPCFVLKTRIFYQDIAVADERWIRLNICGNKHAVSMELVSNYFPNSLFAHIYQTQVGLERDETGAIVFNDRDPLLFSQIILPYMNLRENVGVEELLDFDSGLLDQEFKFWGLASPTDMIYNFTNESKFTKAEISQIRSLMFKVRKANHHKLYCNERLQMLFERWTNKPSKYLVVPIWYHNASFDTRYPGNGCIPDGDKMFYQQIVNLFAETHKIDVVSLDLVRDIDGDGLIDDDRVGIFDRILFSYYSDSNDDQQYIRIRQDNADLQELKSVRCYVNPNELINFGRESSKHDTYVMSAVVLRPKY